MHGRRRSVSAQVRVEVLVVATPISLLMRMLLLLLLLRRVVHRRRLRLLLLLLFPLLLLLLLSVAVDRGLRCLALQK